MPGIFRTIIIVAIGLGLGIGLWGCSSDDSSPTGPTLNSPENLTAVAESDNSISLSWSDIGEVELGFRVQRVLSGGSEWAQVGEVGASVLEYTDTDLEEGTSYSYRVVGFTRTAESGFSNVVAIMTLPVGPTGLAVEDLGGGEVALTWTENSSIEDGVKIQRSLDIATGFETVVELAADEVSYTDTGLTLNTTYYYRVGAFKGDNTSVWSNISSILTISGPENLVAVPEGDTQIILTWDDESPLEYGFSIQRSLDGTAEWNSLASSLDTTYYVDVRLPEGTSYLYRVRSSGRGTESPFSNEAGATTMLSAPQGLKVEQDDPGTLLIQWRDYSDLEEIVALQRSLAESGAFQTLAELPPNTRRYTDSEFSGDQMFDYRVRVVAGELTSNWSAIANVTTSAPPANLRSTVLSDTSIQLDWDDVSDNEDGYFIQIAGAGSQSWLPLSDVGANVTTFSDFRLEEGTSYQYRINSFVGEGDAQVNSPYSNPIIVTTFPKTPTGFTAERASVSAISMSWLDNSRYETGFEIQRALAADGQFESIGIIESNEMSYIDIDLDVNMTYFYRLRANQGMQSSFWTEINSATTSIFTPDAPTGLQVDDAGVYDVTLSWTDNADNERGFTIEFQESDGSDWRSAANIRQADIETLRVQNLRSNWMYSFRVNTYNDSGRSDYSNIVQATTEPGPPEAPDYLRAEAPDHRRVVITWNDNSHDELGFIVQEREARADEWLHLDSLGVDVERVVDNEVEARIQYEYRAAAYNDVGRSAWSNIFRAQVPDAPIQAPTDLAATPRSFSTMRLTWVDRSSNEEAFIIERRQSEEDDYDEIGEAAPNNPQFLDEDLDRGTSYQYRVLAYRGGGQIVSDYSNVVTNSTFAELSAPTGLAAMPNGMSSIWLNWGDSVFQDGFQIERRIEGQGEFEEVSQTDQTTTVDTGLEQETTYEYRVLAFVNYQGDLVVSDYSGVATATTLGEIAFFDDYEEYEVGAPPDREAYNIDAQGESTVLVTEEAAYESNQGLEFDDLPNDGDYVMCFVEHGPVSLGSFSCWLNLAPEGYFGLIGANAADIITWQVQFGNDNTYLVRNGANLEVGGDAYPVGEWIEFRLDYDVPAQTYSIFFNGEPVNEGLQLQQPDQINTQILAIVYNGPDTGIDYVYIDDFEVRRTEPEERGLWVRDSGPGNNQSAVSIQDYLRIGPVR